jgi:hypothetical protein
MNSQMVVCSNKKSLNYQALNSRSKDNAKWTNNVNIDFVSGDTLTLQNAVINLRGSSSDSTIEILGENDPNSYLADSKVGIRFAPYVNDNARANTVALPFSGFTNNVVVSKDTPLIYDGNTVCYPNLNELDNNSVIYPQIYKTVTDNELIFNSGEMIATDLFHFSGHFGDEGQSICSPKNNNIKTLYTKSGTKNSTYGHKYVILDGGYRGPYRSDNQGNFFSGEDDCIPQNLDIKIDLGTSYSAPSTIANIIDDILHSTNNYSDNETQPFVQGDYQDNVLLPSFTGTLLKNKMVNGQYIGGSAGRQGLYGNMAVANIGEWQGLHYMFRTQLSFEGKVSINSDSNFLTLNRPVYLMPHGYMYLNDKNYKNVERPYFPRVKQTMNYEYVKRDGSDLTPVAKSLDFFYSTLPENFLIITNMTYNEYNIKLLKKYQQKKEIYDGKYADGDVNQAGDKNNFRFHLDIGESQQGYELPFGFEPIYCGTRSLYHMSQGNCNIVQLNTDSPTFRAPTMYAYSLPFEPFSDKMTSEFDNAFSTNRSTIPNIGYVQNLDSALPWLPDLPKPFRASIKTITQDVSHRFENNKNGDASLAVKSKYYPEWKSIMRTDNFKNVNTDLNNLYEGNGKYNLDFFNELELDDSLSKQYDLGCYPVSIRSNRSPEAYYNLTNTYWTGLMEDISPDIADTKYSLLYRIIAPLDENHITHGGYSFQKWDGQNWITIDEMYIYTPNNTNVFTGRPAINDLHFKDYPELSLADLDENSTWIVFDYSDNQRFIGVLNLTDDKTEAISISMTYAEPGFLTEEFLGQTAIEAYPLGATPLEKGSILYELRASILGIMTININSKFCWLNVHSGSFIKMPTGINELRPSIVHKDENPPEIVCAFLLYRDSATQNFDGTWTISPDFALPALHQTQFCLSGSFLDHPAVWLINDQLYDSATELDKVSPTNTINFISVGCNNPTFSFENSISKFGFSYLHNPLTLGLNDMPYIAETNTYDLANLGKIVVKVNDDKTQRAWLFSVLDSWIFPDEENPNGGFSSWGYLNTNSGLAYSDGGIYIDSLYGESIQNDNLVADMTLYNSNNWTGSLFWKLGFEYFDLIPSYGNSSVLYDSSRLTYFNSANRYSNLKPNTTNPRIDISMATGLAVQDYTNTDSAGVGEPTFSRSIGSLQDVNLDATNSEIIFASNLPVKNNEGFYLIYTNLCGSNFIQNENTYNIVGCIFKNYQAGDYIYSFATPPVTINFTGKITEIQIELRDSNGNIVALNDDNSIIMLHTKSGPYVQAQLAQQIISENKKK